MTFWSERINPPVIFRMPSVFIDIIVLCEARQFYEVALKSVIELSDLMKHFRHLTGSSI